MAEIGREKFLGRGAKNTAEKARKAVARDDLENATKFLKASGNLNREQVDLINHKAWSSSDTNSQ